MKRLNIVLTALAAFAAMSSAGATNGWFDSKLKFTVPQGRGPVGGVSIIGDAGGRRYVNSWGWADELNKVKFDADTVCWVASNTKGIAAAAVLALVDDGLISLDDPVSKYLPEFANLKVKEKDGTVRPAKTVMTIRHALSHTSGLAFFPDSTRDAVPMRLLAQMGAQKPLLGDPGERFRYSNWGIDVAVAVIEVVTGRNWEEHLKERVLDPLGMNDTTFRPDEKQMRRLAKGYRYKKNGAHEEAVNGRLLDLRTEKVRYAEGGGGLFSTANDLYKFFRMLANNGYAESGRRIFSEKIMDEWFAKQTGASLKEEYSFGMWVKPLQGAIGHGGAWRTIGWADRKNSTVRLFVIQADSENEDVTACKNEWERLSEEFLRREPVDWIDGLTLPIEGRGYPVKELVRPYSRLPLDEKADIPENVWILQQQTAGLAFRFKTDSPSLRVKYLLTYKPVSSQHNPATGKSGVSVYQRNKKGGWDFIAPRFPLGFPVEVSCCYDVPVAENVETLVYLPLYNGIENISFGVKSGCKITPVKKPSEKPVVVYGTSITQGGCASRPGIAWTAVAGRESNLEIVNLGFSGSGRLEIALARCMVRIDAALYVLDNISNLNPDLARERLEPFLRHLKEKRPSVPIMVTHNPWVIHSPNVRNTWEVMRSTVLKLKAEDPIKWKNLSLGAESELFQLDRDYTVDGLHLADWGMMNVGKAFAKEFLKALGR